MAKKESDISWNELLGAWVGSLPLQEPSKQEFSMSGYTDRLRQVSGVELAPHPGPVVSRPCWGCLGVLLLRGKVFWTPMSKPAMRNPAMRKARMKLLRIVSKLV